MVGGLRAWGGRGVAGGWGISGRRGIVICAGEGEDPDEGEGEGAAEGLDDHAHGRAGGEDVVDEEKGGIGG